MSSSSAQAFAGVVAAIVFTVALTAIATTALGLLASASAQAPKPAPPSLLARLASVLVAPLGSSEDMPLCASDTLSRSLEATVVQVELELKQGLEQALEEELELAEEK